MSEILTYIRNLTHLEFAFLGTKIIAVYTSIYISIICISRLFTRPNQNRYETLEPALKIIVISAIFWICFDFIEYVAKYFNFI